MGQPPTDAAKITPLRPKTTEPNYTRLEVRFYRALDALAIQYEKQRAFGPYQCDAYFPALHVVVEAEGCFWHCCPTCKLNDDPDLVAKAERRTAYLRTTHGLLIARCWEHEMQTDADAFNAVRRAVMDAIADDATVGRDARMRRAAERNAPTPPRSPYPSGSLADMLYRP